MFPPSQSLTLDAEAISGICGSISIACWIVVFSPQIIENFRRSSAEGLSIVFIVVWLIGDIFNILGAVLQGVLPTMIILAVYYTLADIVLILQCFYYRGFTLKDDVSKSNNNGSAVAQDETTPLLAPGPANGALSDEQLTSGPKHHSSANFRDRLKSIDGTHLSPATPLHRDDVSEDATDVPRPAFTLIQRILFNLTTVLLVCAAGVFGWWLSYRDITWNRKRFHGEEPNVSQLEFNILGQIFGYICAILYLGSRVPQLLLNYRRQSTEGISMLFFLFACIGNLTYVMSILAYDPNGACPNRKCSHGEGGAIYARYIAVNFSWLLGSFGTLFLDAAVFVQYFLYMTDDDDFEDDEELITEN